MYTTLFLFERTLWNFRKIPIGVSGNRRFAPTCFSASRGESFVISGAGRLSLSADPWLELLENVFVHLFRQIHQVEVSQHFIVRGKFPVLFAQGLDDALLGIEE